MILTKTSQSILGDVVACGDGLWNVLNRLNGKN